MEGIASGKSIIALDDWLRSAPGDYVRAWEQACLDALTADLFGYHALQIGLPQIDGLAANRMSHKLIAGAGCVGADLVRAGARQIAVALDFTELPFASQSLDLVLLPHVLEFAAEPHQVLREVERVLIAEGQVIICGFNPASLWGARAGLARLTRAPFLPPSGELISLPRLKDWLKLLNLGVTRSHFGCYAPPCRSAAWLERCSFMEGAGQRWWPFLGALYVVQAVKRIKGMKLIGPAWTRHTAVAPKGVPATNREQTKQDE